MNLRDRLIWMRRHHPMVEAQWCTGCGEHMTEFGRQLCPVCLDKQQRRAA